MSAGWAVIALGLAGNVHPQVVQPDIGTTIRSMEQDRPHTPALRDPSVDVVEQTAHGTPDTAAEAKFRVEIVHVTGSTVYPANQLEALLPEFGGRETSLADLQQAAARITQFYRAHGYVLARAYVPSQAVRDGAVEIAVLEGRYGRLELHDEAGISEQLVHDTLKEVARGGVIRIAPLERELLLMQDLHGVVSSATLTPGEQVGTANLVVHLTPAERFHGFVDTDNSGNRYTGQLRAGIGLAAANLAGHGDQLTLRGFVTEERGVVYGRARYQMPVGSRGMKIGAALTRTEYALGKQFTTLDANGNATISTLYADYPLVRSLSGSLNTQLAVSYQDLSDIVGATSTTNRRWSRAGTLSLNGEIRDGFLGGGFTQGSLGYASGYLQIRDATARLIDQATLRTAGRYHKLSYAALRLQSCAPSLDLYFALSGQLAGKNLDPSEKFTLGGPNAVRSYPQGEGVGDSAVLGTIELRYALSDVGPLSHPQLVAFFDGGRSRVNQDPFLPGANERSLYGAGVGLNLFTRNGFGVRGNWAWKVGGEPAMSDTDSASRGWIQISKSF